MDSRRKVSGTVLLRERKNPNEFHIDVFISEECYEKNLAFRVAFVQPVQSVMGSRSTLRISQNIGSTVRDSGLPLRLRLRLVL